MPAVPGLRSPYAKVGRLVFFGRMLDKIRLHAAGRLPPDYVSNLGDRHPLFGDGRCCRFLRVSYAAVREKVLSGLSDADTLAWAEDAGGRRSDEECEVWNGFMLKLGWRDRAAARLHQRVQTAGLDQKPIETMFDLMDFNEGRDPVARHAWEFPAPMIIILMGVAGSGKTTIGRKLAQALGWNFRDADEFHPPANIAKMAAGTPLTDEDRAPWLAAIRAYIDECRTRGEDAVLTCSALRESYREQLTTGADGVKFVHLCGTYPLILERLARRPGHFMKPEMLQSQFATLEPPADALAIDISSSPDAIVDEIRQTLSV
ncbi:MAG TPA: gluconokinase, GntK/IdnK-type [Opitutaceae bacterium]|nr:gluconokinase, GntK/IdnK-type [Opitutaceae bacterium]